jgi:hypothetical protein
MRIHHNILLANFFSFGSTAQFWALAASIKLSVSFRLPDLGQSDSLDGWLWWWRSWWNERFWQGKPKYSEKTCPDATLSTTNPTCQTRARTRAAAVGSQRLIASAMARPVIKLINNNHVRETIRLTMQYSAFRHHVNIKNESMITEHRRKEAMNYKSQTQSRTFSNRNKIQRTITIVSDYTLISKETPLLGKGPGCVQHVSKILLCIRNLSQKKVYWYFI